MASLSGLDLGFGTDIRIVDLFSDKVLLFALGTGLVLLATRIFSGIFGASKQTQYGSTVPLAPYWIPIIGHMPQFFIFRSSFFDWARRQYSEGFFAMNLGGTVHTVIFKPELGHMLMNQKNSVADGHAVSRYMMGAIFRYPPTELDVYDRALPSVLDCYRNLSGQPGLGKIINSTVAELRRNINNLVTFSRSPVDQMPWERSSKAGLVKEDGKTPEQEVDLFWLTRDFVALHANISIFGRDFVENNPNVMQDLWQMDKGFMLLAAALPDWIPIPTLMRAAVARRRLLATLRTYEKALDKWADGQTLGSEWADLDDLSEVMKARVATHREYGMSIAGRASIDLALFWATHANANPTVFWMLYRIYSNPTLLADIRKEVAPHVKIHREKSDLPIADVPQLEDVDHEALGEKCLLLKAAYIECLRLDTAVWSFKIMREDCVLSSRAKDGPKVHVQAGTYCHVAHELHHLNPKYYDDPKVWRINRHIRYEPSKDGSPSTGKADMGSIRPYGGGLSMCKGRQFALKEILIFTATIFTFWDMEPVSGEWTMPQVLRTPGANSIKGQYKVKIRRRQIPAMI